MVKKVSDDELDELRRIGEVEYDPETMNIARFGELLEKLEELIAATTQRTTADLERSQVQLEVLATLQKMIRQNGTKSQVSSETVDMEPLRAVLAQLAESRGNEAVAYTFDIKRHEGGLMSHVIATPHEPTRH